MPEYEELKLRVSLDDQASGGLQRLRTEFQQVFSTQNLAQLEKFKRSTARQADNGSFKTRPNKTGRAAATATAALIVPRQR
jgi:hypothetical protein